MSGRRLLGTVTGRRHAMVLPRTFSLLLALFLLAPAATQAQSLSDNAVTLQHRWGTTRIEETPKRIVSLSFIGVDFLLALGIKPIAIRYWYGGNRQGVWPWAEEALGVSEPAILRGEIDVEKIAMLRPDLIEALWSGITEDEYRQLSKIAPVIAPKAEYGAYGTPWPEILKTIARAVGREVEADRLIRALEDRINGIRQDHPDWAGRTAVVGWPGGPGFYTRGDVRSQLMEDLGFTVPDKLERLSLGNFYVTVSRELTAPYDADALIWLDSAGIKGQLGALPLRHTMRAYAEGREIVADPVLGAAMSYSSPLSLGYTLDRLVPLLEVALDGDPKTVVPSSLKAGIVE